MVTLYNGAIERLNSISGDDFSRFKISTRHSRVYKGNALYATDLVRPIMTSVLSTLEYTYGFRKTHRGEAQQPTNIITVNNNNQLSVTVISIQSILEKVTDDNLRSDIQELKAVIEGDKDKKKASRLLNIIQQKSWDVFIALLPVVLEKLGDS